MKYSLPIALIAISLVFSGCKKENGLINLFSINDDIRLGQQVEDEIRGNPAEFPILNESTYASSYAYVNRILNDILNSGKVVYKNDFDWRINIIDNDSVLNAFCAPGGYICIYTGILKYLDAEDEFAGVLAHEIAHADRRHVTSQLTKIYGVSVLLAVVFGDNGGVLRDIASGLASLTFSRSHETDADSWSVKYLCPTGIDARGAAGFFEKLLAMGASSPPAFLSTHPSPDNRVENINEQWTNECGTPGGTFDSRYADFKTTLP